MENAPESKETPKPYLSEPTSAVKESYIEAAKEFGEENEWTQDRVEKIVNDADGQIEAMKEDDKDAHSREGWVPQSTLWMIDGGKYIGSIRIRHDLNDRLKEVGGNIGYDIRPSERKKGYATQLLALGLEKARELGLSEVLITCDEDNIGSQKVIEANGGKVLESDVMIEGREKHIRRYAIELHG